MRIRYIVPFDRKIIIDDHWEIPIQGGKCRVVETNGYAAALECVFENQPLTYSPRLETINDGTVVASITGRDHRMIFVKRQLDHAATFLECIHDIGLNIDEIEAKYEGETPEEEAQIRIKGSSMGRHEPALPLSFDMLTRAIMAAETNDGPKFESTLVKDARKALGGQEFVNSFRYSFLLIESLYGEGQFKKAGLQAALKGNSEFIAIVSAAIQDMIPAKNDRSSDTAKLLEAQPTVDQVIDHIVEKRGFYFHGNIRRKDAWKPDEQGAAETLALLSIGIVSRISMKAADPVFQDELAKRHFEDATRAGATLMFRITFKFREPEEEFNRDHQITISMPGTKPTPRTAFAAAQRFLQLFQHNQPVSELVEAECTLQGSEQKIFHLAFHQHAETDGRGQPVSSQPPDGVKGR